VFAKALEAFSRSSTDKNPFALKLPVPMTKTAPSFALPGRALQPKDFLGPSHDVASMLIGAVLLVDGVGGRIVETEAYDRTDPASHTFSGVTPRNQAMFGPPGRAYVYRSYGIHWCINFVCREEGHGAGVLIRAIEPLQGIDAMRERRGLVEPRLLCSGPGRLGQALGITHELNGSRLDRAPFQVLSAAEPVQVIAGPRIGISKAMDVNWRFGLAGSRFLSRPFRPERVRSALPSSARPL
jgi:DNA-3-methyladenine glycosylase